MLLDRKDFAVIVLMVLMTHLMAVSSYRAGICVVFSDFQCVVEKWGDQIGADLLIVLYAGMIISLYFPQFVPLNIFIALFLFFTLLTMVLACSLNVRCLFKTTPNILGSVIVGRHSSLTLIFSFVFSSFVHEVNNVPVEFYSTLFLFVHDLLIHPVYKIQYKCGYTFSGLLIHSKFVY